MQPLFDVDALRNVEYRGPIPHSDIRSFVGKAAVCVFPTFAEALPVSWLEAMAMGKPLVASDIGWADEIISDGNNGFLIYPGDHSAFAGKINALLENAGLRSGIGARARERSMDFDILKIASENSIFYEEIVNRHKWKAK